MSYDLELEMRWTPLLDYPIRWRMNKGTVGGCCPERSAIYLGWRAEVTNYPGSRSLEYAVYRPFPGGGWERIGGEQLDRSEDTVRSAKAKALAKIELILERNGLIEPIPNRPR